MKKKGTPPKPRNPMAYDLLKPKYRQRVIPNKKKTIPRRKKNDRRSVD